MNDFADLVSIDVPAFARLTDYCGLWAIESWSAISLMNVAKNIDMAAHVHAGGDPVVASVEKMPIAGGKSIAVVKLTGLLMKSQSSMGGTSTIQARRDIRQAAADPDVGGIMLAIDSPGGTVAGTQDLADEVKAARRQKPVWAHVDDLGASAAYWIASQANRVTANSPTALVGSIGTLQVMYDRSGEAEKAGIKTLVMSTGPLKGMGTPGSSVTEDQQSHVQSLVNSVQEHFDAAVQKGRGISAKELATVRHGGVMTAKEAMDAKLIDGIQPFQRSMAQFADCIKTGSMPGMAADAGELLVFTHNSETSPSEPDWSAVDKTALPQLAFADGGEDGKKSTWKYPHHWVQNAGGKDENGVWTTGTLLLHRGGLNAAWSSAMGGRSGQKAPQAVIDHLMAHRRALGMMDDSKQQAAAVLPVMPRQLLPTRAV